MFGEDGGGTVMPKICYEVKTFSLYANSIISSYLATCYRSRGQTRTAYLTGRRATTS